MTTDRLEAAFSFAAQQHAGHMRKGTDIPYISHLLAVTALVLEEIRQTFGDRVAGMVDALSDAAPAEGELKAPWKERKTAYLDQLPSEPPEVLLISVCDKLHNARAILDDVR